MTEPRILVLDDFFPSLESGFRVAEFDWLMRGHVVDGVRTTIEPLGPLIDRYRALYPDTSDGIAPYAVNELSEIDLAYLVFLNNADHYLADLEAHGVPFVVTLYPGGGLDLGNPIADRKLDRVMRSPLLRHVITTQRRTTAYLRDRYGVEVPLTELPGVVVNKQYFTPGAGLRDDYFPEGKSTLDLGFTAYKYMEHGRDKGYPEFVELLRILRARGIPARGHVAGNFTADDVPLGDLSDDIEFAGVRTTAQLIPFFAKLDVLVSPNQPNVLNEGSFDGFPTGSAVEAALCGAALMASDALNQNTLFRDGRDILIVKPSPEAMADRLISLMREPNAIRRIARSGVKTVRDNYGTAAQLLPRARVLASAVSQ